MFGVVKLNAVVLSVVAPIFPLFDATLKYASVNGGS
jgi:hypothetical protein